MYAISSTGKRIVDNSILRPSDVREIPYTNLLNSVPGAYYTVAIWKASGPSSPEMNFLAINMPLKTMTLISYYPPGELNGIYQIQVLRQREEFPVTSVRNTPNFKFPASWNFAENVGVVTFKLENSTRPVKANGPSGYFKPGHDLTAAQEKYCRCTLHVMGRDLKAGKESCLATRNWGPGKPCYNPYSVCAKSTKTSVGRSPKCTVSYNFSGIPDDELRAYATVEGVSIPSPYNKATMINNLETWRSAKGL